MWRALATPAYLGGCTHCFFQSAMRLHLVRPCPYCCADLARADFANDTHWHYGLQMAGLGSSSGFVVGDGLHGWAMIWQV